MMLFCNLFIERPSYNMVVFSQKVMHCTEAASLRSVGQKTVRT